MYAKSFHDNVAIKILRNFTPETMKRTTSKNNYFHILKIKTNLTKTKYHILQISQTKIKKSQHVATLITPKKDRLTYSQRQSLTKVDNSVNRQAQKIRYPFKVKHESRQLRVLPISRFIEASFVDRPDGFKK